MVFKDGVNMSYRIFVSKWVPLYVMAVLLLAALPFVGQTPTAATKKATVTKGYTAPRTPDGKPHMQGVWNSATLTPLTRPKEFANKEFFTPEERPHLRSQNCKVSTLTAATEALLPTLAALTTNSGGTGVRSARNCARHL